MSKICEHLHEMVPSNSAVILDEYLRLTVEMAEATMIEEKCLSDLLNQNEVKYV